jgi:hypothetical protein
MSRTPWKKYRVTTERADNRHAGYWTDHTSRAEALRCARDVEGQAWRMTFDVEPDRWTMVALDAPEPCAKDEHNNDGTDVCTKCHAILW